MMSEQLKLEISTITMVHVVAVILTVMIWMIFFMRARKTSATKSLMVVLLCMFLWMFFKIIKTVAPTITIRWTAIVCYYIGASVLELAFLNFAYANYKNKSLDKKILIPLSLIVCFQILVVATNPLHYLFYKSFDFYHDSFGPLFYLHTLIEYTFIAIGFVFCSKTFKIRLRDKSKWFRSLVSSAIVIPLIMNLIYISKLLHQWIKLLGLPVVFDVTPIVFTWSIVVFVYATYKSDFLDLSPVMKHDIVYKLMTPVIVFDDQLNVCFENDVMEKYTKHLSRIKQSIEGSYHSLQRFSTELQLDVLDLLIHCQEVAAKRQRFYIVTVTDVTTYKMAERNLLSEHKKLKTINKMLKTSIESLKGRSKVSARNFVAREMHDILGHALVVTIKLLEVAQLYASIDQTVSEHAILDAKKLIEQGIRDMEQVSLKKINNISFSRKFIEKDFKGMIDLINHGDIQCHLVIKGDFIVDEHIYVTLKRVTKELITNALKHGQASSIFIGLDFNHHELKLKVIDNGIGCDAVDEGNGLKGIKERLKELNGHLEYASSVNEGFVSKVIIPF